MNSRPTLNVGFFSGPTIQKIGKMTMKYVFLFITNIREYCYTKSLIGYCTYDTKHWKQGLVNKIYYHYYYYCFVRIILSISLFGFIPFIINFLFLFLDEFAAHQLRSAVLNDISMQIKKHFLAISRSNIASFNQESIFINHKIVECNINHLQ